MATAGNRGSACNTASTVRTGAVVMPPWMEFDRKFELTERVLGSGMSGDVVLARRRCGSRPPPRLPVAAEAAGADGPVGLVAVKRLAKGQARGAARPPLLQEARIYMSVDHPNIARLLQVCEDATHVSLVMEYCSGGSLAERLRRRGPFPEADAAGVLAQLLSALRYCHAHPDGKVCHRDLKLDNIMYATGSDDAPVKMIDFGLAGLLTPRKPQLRAVAGTLGYMAPEMVSQRQYTEAQFRELDVDGDGAISPAEFARAMRGTFETPREEADRIFRRLDVNGDERLEWSEYLAAITGAQLLRQPSVIADAFLRLDQDRNGRIDLKELERSIGRRCCGTSTRHIFDECDTNHDKEIDIIEFSIAFNSVRKPPPQVGMACAEEGRTPLQRSNSCPGQGACKGPGRRRCATTCQLRRQCTAGSLPM